MTPYKQAEVPIAELVDLMNYKLFLNRDKPHWDRDDIWDMMARLIQEKDELLNALSKWSLDPTLENWQNVEYEIADVANFGMMMIDIGRSTSYSALRSDP